MIRKNHIATLLAFAIGIATGWLAKPKPVVDETAKPAHVERTRQPRPSDAEQEIAKSAKRWVDRIEAGRVGEVAKEIPAGDFRRLVELMMESVWGGMTDVQQQRLGALIGEWALRDQQGALAWARGLRQPQQREVSLVSIAAAVAKSDPKAGFDIYAELDEASTSMGGRLLSEMMRNVYTLAGKEGIEAILDVAKRTPANKTRTVEIIPIDYPEGTDFAALLAGLPPSYSLPFMPSDPLGAWALKDSDAAFAFAASRASQGNDVNLGDMVYQLSEKNGNLEAERWMGEKLAALDSKGQQALLQNSGLANSLGILRKYVAAMPSEEASAEFRMQVIQFSAERKFSPGFEILNDVPAVEDRVAMIQSLRGVKDDSGIRMFLKKWEIPDDRISGICKTVAQPANP